MPREDKWVAVAPQFSGTAGTNASAAPEKIRPPTSAYNFFQKDVTTIVKTELSQQNGKYNIGDFSRAVRDRWNRLDEIQRAHYEDLARADQARFAQESHRADIAALERRQQMQQNHQQLMLTDNFEDDDDAPQPQRSTRNQYKQKQQQKEQPRQRKKKKPTKELVIRDDDDDDDSDDDDDESEDSYHEGGEDDEEDDVDEESSFDSDNKKKKKKPKKSPKPPTPKKPVTQKQMAHREKVRQQREEKETFIAQRQDDLRKERVDQAKRRLEFLLQQSDIFSHFGQVQQDQVKYGLTSVAATAAVAGSGKKKGDDTVGGGASRRRGTAVADSETLDAQELEQEAVTNTTYLTTQPSTLGHGEMRAYQLEGLNWMIRLQENGVNGILADEMGLGKTLQSISILVYMMEYQQNGGPHLIVVPKSTLSNWMAELARWAPTLKAIKFHGDKEERTALSQRLINTVREEDRDWHVCVTTYEVCNIEKNVLGKFAWAYLIIDEAHRLKNEASSFSKTVRTFETKYRILLTGTPLQNSLHELWALLNFLVPDVFASAEQFDEWFNLDIDDVNEKNKLISQLHKILRPFMLRRLKADVEKSLPPKHETILFTGMSSLQKKIYRDILLRDFDALQGKSGSRNAILNIVMQLRKCAGHPYLFPGVEDRTLPPLGEHLVENCGKMVVLDKLLMRLHERGHRVLLFTQMTRILDIMEDYLVMRRFPYCRIDGNTTYEQREDFIDAFNAPESEKFIFLLSTRAGGLGINLQTADVVILYDSDWNPQADLQAQDRAHRIGQKRPVQVFRLVTEHTIEEKIVERAQQKLKLDAMVVQQGRFRDKDNKLSRDELLEAVKFGADKIFKSKDSSITDDDIDLILDAGKRKTQELNEKLKVAEKGDLLDFKLDGGTSVRTFEGVDYANNALSHAKQEADLLGIMDIGKRERRSVANYNESALYQQQIAALQGGPKPRKLKVIKLPKTLRLPRMEEWQMYDRVGLQHIQEEEEAAFRALPEEQQKIAALKSRLENEEAGENELHDEIPTDVELPPLLNPERQAEKDRLLSEGFVSWKRHHYSAFIKACARYGRSNVAKIALEVGKSEGDVQEYANAFWGEKGKSRISEHEYERAVKLIERGEKKIGELKGLERGTRVLLSIFENPWEELEFTYVNCKDKMFTMEEDRYLLCWTHKFGYGQWEAIKMAIRRSPNFRFDYFLKSLPTDLIGRRCEQLMKAAEKEVEQLERKAREDAGLPVEPEEEGGELPPVKLPNFRQMQRQQRIAKQQQTETQRKQLEEKVDELEDQLCQVELRLKELNELRPGDSFMKSDENHVRHGKEKKSRRGDGESEPAAAAQSHVEEEAPDEVVEGGAIGPDGTFVEFPEYDVSEPPKDYKKAFTHFCNATRREVKASLSPAERKDKAVVNNMLREQFLELSDDDKKIWKKWAAWDKQRYEYQMRLYENQKPTTPIRPTPNTAEVLSPEIHVPKKRANEESGFAPIPKRRK